MASRIVTSTMHGFRLIGAFLRRSEIFMFLPALTLAAFWLGGERVLILTALGAPLIFALSGAVKIGSGQALMPDPLEGLSLRGHIVSNLDAILANAPITGRTTACLVLQFDQMDRLIDRFGRAAQSEVLARSAERICASLRSGDLVARLEGGGFAVALAPVRRLNIESVVQVASRLQSALSTPISLDGTKLYANISIGFCLAEGATDQSGSGLLNAAQIAADEALRHGPSALRGYSPDMTRNRSDRDALREELERALDEGQIRPYFQPQISTHTGEITGFEALARWHHPDKGLIPPADFLPMIEDSGLSERLGEVILFQSLTALTRWDRAGLKIPTVAVNFSGQELRNPRLAEKLKWELDRFEVQPQRLSIEILENVVAQTDNDILVSNIAAIAKLGCGIDLDDFGTGHASITSIRRFAVKRIKIDRSFVTRLDEDREQQKMVSAILSMAERLGLETLAEGVETPGEHAMLAQLGCGDVQGFGIARPMPIDETLDWIARHRATAQKIPKIGSRTR